MIKYSFPLSVFLILYGQLSAYVILPGPGEGSSGLSTAIQSTARTYQFVYGSSLLEDIPIGHQITGMAFRIVGGYESPWPSTERIWANYDIQLSSSVNAPGSLSTTFSNNIGTDVVTVRSGPLTIGVGTFPYEPTPTDFGPEIVFTTPFTYQGGHLLFTIRHDGNGVDWRFLDAVSAVAGLHQGLAAGGYNAAISEFSTVATVVRLTVIPELSNMAQVPEPSNIGLAAVLVLGGLIWFRRRRANKA